jgi:3-oxoacyl-ACP reductase-like protein
MRTTLDLDDDVLLAARAHAAREKRSLGAVISELARESLQRPSAPAGRARGAGGARGALGGRFAVLPARKEVVTVEHVRRLMDAEGV